jgi:hypothetical protein
MFRVPNYLGYSRRQTPHRFEFRRARAGYPEEITRWGINWRDLKEAWIVKIERGSPRAMQPMSSREA